MRQELCFLLRPSHDINIHCFSYCRLPTSSWTSFSQGHHQKGLCMRNLRRMIVHIYLSTATVEFSPSLGLHLRAEVATRLNELKICFNSHPRFDAAKPHSFVKSTSGPSCRAYAMICLPIWENPLSYQATWGLKRSNKPARNAMMNADGSRKLEQMNRRISKGEDVNKEAMENLNFLKLRLLSNTAEGLRRLVKSWRD